MSVKCLIDTGIIFSMINEKDENRENGLKFAESIKSEQISPIITDYIVDELLTRIITKLSIVEAIKVRDFIESGYFEFHKIEESEYEETFRIFFKYNQNRRKKKGISFTDCSNVVVASKLSIKQIASFDSGFDVFKNICRIGEPNLINQIYSNSKT